MPFRIHGLLLPALAVLFRSAALAEDSPAAPSAQPLLTIGEAVRSALRQNVNLANTMDALLSARVHEHGVASTFLPQAVPFFSLDRSQDTGARSETYGVSASEQFLFGTLLEGAVSYTRSPVETPDTSYGTLARLTLTQPLLRGADPAVTAEPLRQARRSTQADTRALEVTKRQTLLLVYRSYLGISGQQETSKIATERLERARKLTEFSRARFAAGSLSRLDVLRAEQQEAAAVVARNDAQNLVEDLRDALRRVAGLPPDLDFEVEMPRGLPDSEEDFEAAVSGMLDRRPEALEARDQVRDGEFAVRIAKSQQLPSVQAVVTYESSGIGTTASDAFHQRNNTLLFGVRSQYGLNSTVLTAQRRQAELDLEVRKRNLVLLQDDLVRELRASYRRLASLRANYDIAVGNERVAELQLQVAQLRFERGLSDNFNVVDAENLLNATRLLALNSRISILLARLDCLYSSGRLDIPAFAAQP